jgi:putative addiction module antidote
MIAKLQVRKIGNSFGVILPKEFLQNLHVQEGDNLHIIQDEKGAYLTPYDPQFENVMSAYQEFSHHYRNALKELAK